MGSGHSSQNEAFDASGEVNFDHFQILRAIGKGSFGKVCIVQKKDSKKMYAMKYMNKAMCAKQEAISNVLREVDLLKKVEHAFIVNLWYCFQDQEDMFMVVDLLLGGDLRFHMQEDVNFSEMQVQLYIAELSLALSYLRSKQILHRDIKPDNVLLDEDGHVHLTDFNIATELEEGDLATSVSGTKPYMAPEIFSHAMGDCPGYGYPVDWWALGVTAYELLKKRRPFGIHGEHSAQQTLQTICNTKISSIVGVSDHMNELIIQQMLNTHADKRLQSLTSLKCHPAMSSIDFDQVLAKNIKPQFVPSKDHLNCDPTYELEEMIIETKPLHKKKKRLAKQMSKKESMSSSENVSNMGDPEPDIFETFKYYNRARCIDDNSHGDVDNGSTERPSLQSTQQTHSSSTPGKENAGSVTQTELYDQNSTAVTHGPQPTQMHKSAIKSS